MNKESPENDIMIFKHIKNYWVLYLFVANIIVTFTTTSSRLSALEARASKIEEYRDEEQIVLVQMQKDIASINTSILFIKENIKK